ncbi:MAG: PKD domain-containing protein [Thermoplasmata archaeon]
MLVVVLALLMTVSLVIVSVNCDVGNTSVKDAEQESVFDSRFSPPHSDSAIDDDGDGLFDFLVIHVNVIIAAEGLYGFGAALFAGPDASGPFVDATNVSYNLATGSYEVDIYFRGGQIRANGYDCNYTVFLYLLNQSAEIDQDVHTTSFYSAADFEQGDVDLTEDWSEQVLDTNGNSRYDFLVIQIVVEVYRDLVGKYWVDGTLLDPEDRHVIDVCYFNLENSAGTQLAQLNFSGLRVYEEGRDGPFLVVAELRNESYENPLDRGTYLTLPYDHAQFEPPLGIVEPITDIGLDTDGDGLYNHLMVNVTVNLNASVEILLVGTLEASPFHEMIETVENWTNMSTGIGVVGLMFDGIRISSCGTPGPYLVQLELYCSDGAYFYAQHITNPYTPSDFERAAYLVPPFSCFGIDIDSDTLFDQLAVKVTVNTEVEGRYLVFGTLWNSQQDESIDRAGNVSHLSIGYSEVVISFCGWRINAYGEAGHHNVTVELCLMDGAVIDSITMFDVAYTPEEFDPPEPLTGPWLETFEKIASGKDVPDGWWVSIPQSVSVGSQTAETGLMSLGISGTEPFVEVVCPLIDVSGLDVIKVRCWVRFGSPWFSDAPDWGDFLEISLWNSTEWIPIGRLEGGSSAGHQILVMCNLSVGYEGFPSKGLLQLRFLAVHGRGPAYDYWHIDNVYVGPPREPIASFTAAPAWGDVTTLFVFNSSMSWDIDTLASNLMFRWDWEGDGSWDTDWSSNCTAVHQFSTPGTYHVVLEVLDGFGNANTTSLEVVVLEFIPEFSGKVPLIAMTMLTQLMAVALLCRKRSGRRTPEP